MSLKDARRDEAPALRGSTGSAPRAAVESNSLPGVQEPETTRRCWTFVVWWFSKNIARGRHTC